MAISNMQQVVPLTTDQDGVMRVGDTRVTLTSVIHAFEQGHTAEEIVSHFPALRLADVYAVIAYYLNSSESVRSYLATEDAIIKATWQRFESNRDYQMFRSQLLARKKALTESIAP